MPKLVSITQVFLVGIFMLLGQAGFGQKEFAQHRIDSLKNIDLSPLDEVQRAAVYYHIARNYTYWMVDSSTIYGERALGIFRKVGYDQGVYNTLSMMVEQLYINGELYKSIKYAFELESWFLANNVYAGLPSLYNSIGNNLKRQGDFKGALNYYNRSAKQSMEQNQMRYYTFSRMNMAFCYIANNKIDSAYINCVNALKLSRDHVKSYTGFITSLLGRIQLRQVGNTDSALFNLKLGIRLAKLNNEDNSRAITTQLNFLAEGFQQINQIDSAIFYAKKSRRLAKEVPVVLEQERAARILYECFESKGQLDSAFYFLKEMTGVGQQIDNLAGINEIKHLSQKIEKLKGQVQLQKKNEQVLLIAGIGLLILILAIATVTIARKKNQAEKLKRQAEFQQLKRDSEQKEHALQNTTVELVKSNTNFAQLLQNIEQLSVEMKVETRKKARSILMDYRVQLQDETWQKFNLDFENANAGFYHELRTRFPSITDSELRISAMHVSGLNNKEISAITGQQISSLHTHKSRLRKKLNVQNDAELMDLLKSAKTM